MSTSLYPGDFPNQESKLLCCPSVTCFPCELSHQIAGRMPSLQFRSSSAVRLNHASLDSQIMSDFDTLFPSPSLSVSLSVSLCFFLSLSLALYLSSLSLSLSLSLSFLTLSFSLSLCLLFFLCLPLSLSRERHW